MKRYKYIKSFLFLLILLFLLCNISYSMVAFVLWEINPNKWSTEAQYLLNILWIISIFVSSLLALFYIKSDKEENK